MKISCLGDSITAGYGVKKEENWVFLLNQETNHEFENQGLIGDTMSGMLSRLDSMILSGRPRMVFLLGGWNDLMICKTADTAKTALMAMVHHCVKAGVIPVVGIPYAVAHIPAQWRSICTRTMDFDGYRVWVKDFCKAFHLRSIDLGSVFEGRDDLLLDGLHPNALGHRAIADAVKRSGWFGEGEGQQ